ncbi:MAG: ABC transporter ATP-binding protein [Anaerolineales bacterium]|nr:ABC transporter ATP-binding protein [Anaerolineales bacterium]
MALLEVTGLTKNFGGLAANQDITLSVEDGTIVGLIGPNGAGKTTLFNTIAGLYAPDAGRVVFAGADITGWPPERVCRAGIGRTFQITKSFRQMTVLENVMVGAFLHTFSPRQARQAALAAIEKTGLLSRKDMLAGNLTVADRKRLEVARALATRPRMLMLDEAMAGLNPKERQEAVELILFLAREGTTILLVEHVMEVVMPISHRLVVLDYGKQIAEGKPEAIARDERVIKAYLGERYRAPG